MPKFMILFKAVEPSVDFMASSSPEEIKAGMAAWLDWKNEAVKTVGFEFGMPLQIVANVTAEGAGPSTSDVSNYSIMEGDTKELVIEALKTHPHLKRIGASIDVLEMVSPS